MKHCKLDKVRQCNQSCIAYDIRTGQCRLSPRGPPKWK